MTDSIRHRGPDDEGYYESPAGRVVAGLGFRRLSIIDLTSGNQPISNEDGSVWLAFNGEIYNFRELRAELEHRGHHFSTHTDTEVIVHLYEESGPGCFERLNGMFAIAIWDERQSTLTLARDRFGKKPLYYAAIPEGLIFGSELKALLRHPSCPRSLDSAALSRYLAFEYVPEPDSILAGVKKLPAAHVLTWRDGQVALERYWRLTFRSDGRRREGDVIEEFHTRFQTAVRRRLLSDVPLGAFLSGGVDSSSVVAMMAELLPAKQIKTFSMGFTTDSFDESSHARRVAEHYGTDHHEETFTAARMLDMLDDVADFLDEPFADPSVLPTYLLSTFTRGHVTVALGGDGADELLAGYPTFAADRLASLYHLPSLIHDRIVVPVVDRIPVSTADFSIDFKLKRFLRGLPFKDEARHAAWLGAFTPEEIAELLTKQQPSPYAPHSVTAGLRGGRKRVEQLIAYYVESYLANDILVKVDRASMAASLEVRAPFLDVDLVEFLAGVPAELKLRVLTSKYLLKRAMAGVLPSGIAQRPKKGFGIPVAEWLKTSLRERLLEELGSNRLRAQGIFEPEPVQRLIREHLAGRRDHRKALWTLLMFQLWHRRFEAGMWS